MKSVSYYQGFFNKISPKYGHAYKVHQPFLGHTSSFRRAEVSVSIVCFLVVLFFLLIAHKRAVWRQR